MRPAKRFTGDDIFDAEVNRDIARLRRERREAEQAQRPKRNQQSDKASRAYQRRPMPVRTAEGNGEERSVQIQHIQQRMARLHRMREQIRTEVKQLTDDVKTLTEEPTSLAPPEKEPN